MQGAKHEANSHDYWMTLALKAAQKAEAIGEVPVGAVIVKKNEIVSIGYNKREKLNSPLAHAEMIAIEKACKKLNSWRLLGCRLYVTLEPCAMCSGTLVQTRIDQVIFGAFDQKAGACGSVLSLHQHEKLNHRFEAIGGILGEDCGLLLKDFFKRRRSEKATKSIIS